MANTEDDKDSREPSPQAQADTGPAPEEASEDTPPAKDEQHGEDPTILDDDRPVFETKEEALAAMASPKAEPAPRKGGVLGPVIGGILAAGIGYGAAQYVKPEGWPFPGSTGLGDEARTTLAAADEKLAQTEQQIADLQAQVAQLGQGGEAPDLSAPIESLQSDVASLAEQVTGFETRLTELDGRVEDFAKGQIAQQGEEAAAAVAAYEREIAAMREDLAAQRDENAKLADSVAAVADEAEAEVEAALDRTSQVESRAALMSITAALASGSAFDSALDRIEGVDIPEALTAVAAQGVPTLAELQDSFPSAARAALDVALAAEAEGNVGNRLTAFMRSQLGVRSLEPREGDDADAVLSRAEAALRDGEIETALGELDALSDPAKAEMQGWIDDATARLDALGAAQTLEQRLNN